MSGDDVTRAVVALLLIVVALSYLPAWLLSLGRRKPPPRCSEQGNPLGWSAAELDRFRAPRGPEGRR